MRSSWREALVAAQVRATGAENEAQYRALLIEKLKYTIRKLRHERFGQSSERGALLEQLECAGTLWPAKIGAEARPPSVGAIAAIPGPLSNQRKEYSDAAPRDACCIVFCAASGDLFRREISAFPRGRHSDQVDAFSQAGADSPDPVLAHENSRVRVVE
jgi:hypothetical protein